MKELNLREQKYVNRYMIHGNKSRAWKEAGYAVSGVAGVTELHRRPHVQAALRQAQEEIRDQAMQQALLFKAGLFEEAMKRGISKSRADTLVNAMTKLAAPYLEPEKSRDYAESEEDPLDYTAFNGKD